VHQQRAAGQERLLVEDPGAAVDEIVRADRVPVGGDGDVVGVESQPGRAGPGGAGRVGGDGEQGESDLRVGVTGDRHQQAGVRAAAVADGGHDPSPRILIEQDPRIEWLESRVAGLGSERRPERLQRDRPRNDRAGRLVEDGKAAVEDADEMIGTGRALGQRVVRCAAVVHPGEAAACRGRDGGRGLRRRGLGRIGPGTGILLAQLVDPRIGAWTLLP
jgi:hypothetical protein